MAEPKRTETISFEGNEFVQECLDAFDANIEQIEKYYDVASKSA